MSAVEPVAKAVVKKSLKDKAKSQAKKVATNAAESGKENIRKGAKNFTRRYDSIRTPKTLKTHRSHNLLVAMWFAGTLIILSELVIDGVVSTDVWKRMFAFQMTMFVLSWLVLIDTFTVIVAWFSVLVVIALALAPNRAKNIADIITGFGNKDKPTVKTNSGGSAHLMANLAEFNKPIVPRGSQTTSATDTAPAQNTSGSDYFSQTQST